MYKRQLTLTDITKIAVRRPRPIDYINCPPVQNPTGTGTVPNPGPGCNSTDLGLSFFSGHAAAVASIGATATYLAFVRSPSSPRPWITLGVATAVSYTHLDVYKRQAHSRSVPST